MIESATGIVVRTYPLTETSLIVHWLTPSFGRMATVAKGARRPKSPFHGKLDLFYMVDFSFARSRRSELHTLREVTLRDSHSGLRRELGYVQQASYCDALIESATETETPLPTIFELLKDMLNALVLKPPQPQTVLAFELKLLNELGLEPDLGDARLSPPAKAAARTLQQADWPSVMKLKLDAGQTEELRRFLHGFIIYHLGRVPKGRDAALATGERNGRG